jgi:hypothetical protein
MPQTSTYVIYNCSAVAKKLLVSCAQTQEPPTLLRPFAVDTFLVEDMLETWTVKLSKFRTRLIGYVSFSIRYQSEVSDLIVTLRKKIKLSFLIQRRIMHGLWRIFTTYPRTSTSLSGISLTTKTETNSSSLHESAIFRSSLNLNFICKRDPSALSQMRLGY